MSPQDPNNALDYFSRRRSVKELLNFDDDDSGYVEGKVFMTWPPRNKLHRISFEVAEDSVPHRFEVAFPLKDGIAFRPHERISLALKGMKVDRRMESSAPRFPIVLRFPHGVVLKYLTGAHAGKVVNTLEGEANNRNLMSTSDCTENTDEWYNPSLVPSVSNGVASDVSGVHHNAIPETTDAPKSSLPRKDISSCHKEDVTAGQLDVSSVFVADNATIVQSVQPAQQFDAKRPGQASRRSRKKRRLRKEKESNEVANDASNPPSADIAIPSHEQAQNVIDSSSTNVSGNLSMPRETCGGFTGETSIKENFTIDDPPESNDAIAVNVQDPGANALHLKAGVRTQSGDIFTALRDLQKDQYMVNVIGVVTLVSPEKKTSSNEWSRSFTLVDHSVEESLQQGIKINCFQKKYAEWLPQVQNGDIVILRKLRIVEFNNALAATGYGDKLRWAVYDTLTHSIRPPNKGSAPERELTNGGMGYEFCPYWDPSQDSTELEYCRQIGEWWRAKCAREGRNVSMIQCAVRPTKQHLLISEVSPDRPPNGFFNCTVEVLQKFDDHDPADVYVTDYTASALVHPVQASWCPPGMSGYVLKCTMWDNARNMARMMNPGEYWYFHNVRAKRNPNNQMEGTMQLAEKVTLLDTAQLETKPHLKALLERKKEFKPSISSIDSGMHIFPEMLFQDVDGNTSFLTCVIELLHIDFNSANGHFIYVTDYTYNPDLPTTFSTASWAHNLEHRVLKIKLDNTQAQTTSDLSLGSVYIIHNLRIKRFDASGTMHGYLGGEHTLIVPLCDPSSHHAQALWSNKEKWKREDVLRGLTTLPNESHKEAQETQRVSSTISDSSTLREVLAKPAPNLFRVLARVVDFFPFSLEDACVLRCTKCNLSPPPSFKRCPRCDDMMETHSKWVYCLYIMLQDNQGSELIVSLSGRECMLLHDNDPADFRCDREAFRKFLEKMDPILGNLRDVHAAWSKNEPKVIESSSMIFTLESWNIGDEKGYSLVDYNLA